MEGKEIHADILVVSSKYPPEYAGSGLRAHRTYKRLAGKFGYRYEVLASSVVFNRRERYFFEGVPVYRIARKLFTNIKNSQDVMKESLPEKIARKLKNGVNYLIEALLTWAYLFQHGSRFDLFHIFGNSGYVTPAVLTYAKIVDKPVIVENCNVPKARKPFYEPLAVKMLFGKGLPHRSKIVCISRRLEDQWRESAYKDDINDIWCRPNPVDGSRFFIDGKNKSIHRRRLGLFDEEAVVLLNIGKMRPLKNQIFLIEVLKGLPREYKLVIAGPIVKSGPYLKEDSRYFKEIKARISGYGLEDRVRIENRFIDNVDEYMKASDIYLLPSTIEACATPVLEALACGLPVVAHRIEGVTTEWIKEGVNGYLAVLDADLFRQKIIMARSLDKAGLKKGAAQIQASSDAMDQKYADLIEELVHIMR
ncbi:glycosyltransferase family 4 protein [Omnitrophica bacterium]|nr:glycosyltransferase family 4 protein [Candidatus Omnitrophota bacterium]